MEDKDLISEFMGYEKVTVGYSSTDDETQWQKDNEKWMDEVGMDSVGEYYVNIPKNKWFYSDDVNYMKWRLLMRIVQKIEKMGYEICIINNECDIGENIDAEHYVGIISKKEKSKKLAVYSSIIEFIKWFNEKKI